MNKYVGVKRTDAYPSFSQNSPLSEAKTEKGKLHAIRFVIHKAYKQLPMVFIVEVIQLLTEGLDVWIGNPAVVCSHWLTDE